VRLLVDAFRLEEPNKSGLPAYLAGVPNFEIRYYNDTRNPLAMNLRMHVKALVVDGWTEDRLSIVGGRNLSDDYFGLGSKVNFIDQDLVVRGDSVSQIQKQFVTLWNAGGWATAGGNSQAFAATCLRQNARDKQVGAFLTRSLGGDALPVRTCDHVEFAVDRPDFQICSTCLPGETEGFLNVERFQKKLMTKLFVNFISATRSKLEIANQYYMPAYLVNTALFKLRWRRVNVDVLTSAVGDIEVCGLNQSFTCYIQSSAFRDTTGSGRVRLISSRGAMNSRWDLSVSGAEWRIHTKSAVRDGRDVLVSSFNIDPRSYHTNLESGVVVENCPELAADVSAQYELLRGFASTDRSCSACRSEINPAYKSPYVFCGGTPDLF